MRHYITVVFALLLIFLAMFALVEAADIAFLTDPTGDLAGAGPYMAAAVGVGLLIADVVLPVPSSLVMIMHGALFGVVLGTVLSLAGSLGAALVGFAIGRRGGPLLDKLVPASERRRADDLLGRWGAIAVVVTRPVPLLAETTAVLAGASHSISWQRFIAAATTGSLPMAVLYAAAGATAVGFANLGLVFALALALAAITGLVERGLTTRARHAAAAHTGNTAGNSVP
ncbi:MAG: VTT domain-containing protein [Arthrobacter sp.]